MHRSITALTAAVLLVLLGCAAPPTADDVADVVLVGGRVVTLDDAVPEGTAIAIRDDRILAVGDDATIRARAGEATRVLDLEGRLVLPGFIEGHGHFLGLGAQSRQLDLRPARTWDEIVAQVADAAAGGGDGWIVGRGWHQEKWDQPPSPAVDGFPTRDELDRVAPDRPVLLTHASGHAAIANGAALAAAGIDDATLDPEGGRIERDPAGRATGLLHETASGPVKRALAASLEARGPEAVRRDLETTITAAAEACLAHGVTSFQDAGSTLDEVAAFDALAARGRLPVRLWVMLGEPDAAIAGRLDEVRRVGAHDGFLTVRAIKRYSDGALGNRGAWLLEPYADAPETSGIPVMPIAEIEASAALARDHDYQLCVHAIGDRANREVLDVFERTLEGAGDRRFRIEHAQHLHPDDILRFAELGVVASMQAVHCTSDGPWVPSRLGERRAAEGAYAWRSLIDAGAVLSNGSDVPVEPIDPIAGIHALVTRRMADGNTFHPAQAIDRIEAIRAATAGAAYAAFEDEVKGTLTPGKYADLVVLDRDLLRIPAEEIPETKVWMTMVAGNVAWGGPDDPRRAE